MDFPAAGCGDAGLLAFDVELQPAKSATEPTAPPNKRDRRAAIFTGVFFMQSLA
jgi:hypothetical protein